MFTYLYQWMQNLACYMLLVTAVLEMLPQNSYRRYVRFFCNLILVILLAGPILQLAGAGNKVTELYRTAEYEQMKKELEEAGKYMDPIESESSAR